MLRRLLILLLALPPGALTAQTLRVLSYNIHHGEGMDGRIGLERIAKVILSVDPDAVALQEVDIRTARSGGVDQLEELARLTGMKKFFGKTIDHQGGDYGNAVLTKLPAVYARNEPLPGKEPRALMEVTLTLGRASVPFFATHLDASREEALRIAAAKRILEIAPGRGPAILAGDLNAVPESETLALLETQGAWARAGAPGILPTFPVREPRRQIDYILHRPADRWRTVEIKVLDEAIASDHRPIFAVLELLGR
jgi:endonuclease/exonuclease/phosphatase family metal-dependent hydrolase